MRPRHDERDALRVPDPLEEALSRIFGLTYLFPYQRLVIANILSAAGFFGTEAQAEAPGNQIIILPTGAGKSLCFQLPATLLPGLTLVVFPLLSLMTDQARRLKKAGVPCDTLRGGQPRNEREAVFQRCASGASRIVLTNPETAGNAAVLERLAEIGVAHLVADEAHCVTEWGETFRPSYLEMRRIIEALHVPLVTAFTATASSLVLSRVRALIFGDEPVNLVNANPDRPNIGYSVRRTLCKDHTLVELSRTAKRPLLVFCRSRFGAEATARVLRERLAEREIFFYHAGLERHEKRAVEEWFFQSQHGILAATCAYGMGVDKSDIRTVVHRDLSPSVEAYLQESGRAGRDREQSEAVVLLSPEDVSLAQTIEDQRARERYQALLAPLLQLKRCRREALLSLLDAEVEACFGCDVCRKGATEAADGETELVATLRSHRRRFTRREARHFLRGAASADTGAHGLWRFRGFGTLADWTEPELSEAIAACVRAGVLRVPKRGPWKHRITVGRTGAHGLFPLAVGEQRCVAGESVTSR